MFEDLHDDLTEAQLITAQDAVMDVASKEIRFSNALLGASYTFNETEIRFLLLTIAKAQSQNKSISDLKGATLTLHADEYCKFFGVKKQTAYRVLEQVVESFFNRSFVFKILENHGTDTKVRKIYQHFLQRAEYIKGSGKVELKFADDVLEFVEALTAFTPYELSYIARFRSKYSVYLYHVLMQFRSTKIVNISVDLLRLRLGLQDTEMVLVADLRRYAIDKAIRDINEFSNIAAQYEIKKNGRKIERFIFTFDYKKGCEPKKQQQKVIEIEASTNETPTLEQKTLSFLEQPIIKKILFDLGDLTDYEKSQLMNDTSRIIEMLDESKDYDSEKHRFNKIKKSVKTTCERLLNSRNKVKAEVSTDNNGSETDDYSSEISTMLQSTYKTASEKDTRQQIIEEENKRFLEMYESFTDEEKQKIETEAYNQVSKNGNGAFAKVFKDTDEKNRHNVPMFRMFYKKAIEIVLG